MRTAPDLEDKDTFPVESVELTIDWRDHCDHRLRRFRRPLYSFTERAVLALPWLVLIAVAWDTILEIVL